ncbi:hypothetical protein PspKH34_19520 [Parageobacillus sp. KH3-4]|jgi:hypothetical protein|uniref:Uncharacterized protein n=1 Tax=Parageobacillus thermoglucosidasius TaxID=1426 RepID=A0A1B7KMB5_PARTM|nr:hypothetical protein A7K69_15750 [Parageobacillus thermoglucosidasius]BDG47391.1 hypothetical protein PspKH34_19520 [Parageobacillus sp. KH3-4]
MAVNFDAFFKMCKAAKKFLPPMIWKRLFAATLCRFQFASRVEGPRQAKGGDKCVTEVQCRTMDCQSFGLGRQMGF